MSSDYDATEFVDSDFQAAQKASFTSAAAQPAPAAGAGVNRAPTREEVDSKVGEAQHKLAELKRIQEELERERAGLEETRRRQIEFQTGRQEVLQNLTRGVGLLEEAEFAARRDAEQMAKSLADMREALARVEAAREDAWTRENFQVELTRALTTIENARMEWNSARLKYPVLSGATGETDETKKDTASPEALFTGRSFFQLCKLGLAMTWPLAIVALLALCVFLAVLLGRR